MKKKAALFLLLTAIIVNWRCERNVNNQNPPIEVNLSGVVTDSLNNEPVAGVKTILMLDRWNCSIPWVRLDQAYDTTITDEHGKFAFNLSIEYDVYFSWCDCNHGLYIKCEDSEYYRCISTTRLPNIKDNILIKLRPLGTLDLEFKFIEEPLRPISKLIYQVDSELYDDWGEGIIGYDMFLFDYEIIANNYLVKGGWGLYAGYNYKLAVKTFYTNARGDTSIATNKLIHPFYAPRKSIDTVRYKIECRIDTLILTE